MNTVLPSPSGQGRLAALDGLRGVAVLAVIAFHWKTRVWFPGGSFGVDLFFVLSGFLITSLLLQEWRYTRSLSLPGFYVRRALRLLPAAFVFFGVYLAVVIVAGDRLAGARPDSNESIISVGYALVYGLNWAAALGVDVPLEFIHIWSLSVEEQYYLVWPLFVLLLLRLHASPSTMLAITVLLAILSSAVPLLLHDTTWERLYFGADFRAQGLLLGSAAGQLYARGNVPAAAAKQGWYDLIGWASIAFLGFMLVEGSNRSPWFCFPLVSVACVALIFSVVRRSDSLTTRILESAPLLYLGRRSYALYLWHVPLGQWLSDLSLHEQLVVAGVLSLLAAEISHRLVEEPARRWKERIARVEWRQIADAARSTTPDSNSPIGPPRSDETLARQHPSRITRTNSHSSPPGTKTGRPASGQLPLRQPAGRRAGRPEVRRRRGNHPVALGRPLPARTGRQPLAPGDQLPRTVQQPR